MTITEKQLRAKIAEIIEATCPTAKVFRRNVLTADRAKWAGLFRHQAEINGELRTITFSFIVRRIGITRNEDETFVRHIFEILGFYGFYYGNSTANSEDEWQAHLDNLYDSFDATEDLSLDDKTEIYHDGLQISSIGLIRVAESEFLHFAGGQLVIRVYQC